MPFGFSLTRSRADSGATNAASNAPAPPSSSSAAAWSTAMASGPPLAEPPGPGWLGARVVWLSVDPRTGDLSLYPWAAISRLEQARRAGGPSSVPLAGLGGFYETVVIEIDLRGNGDHAQQRTANGKRDVRRFDVEQDATEVTCCVVRERGWRIADAHVPGVTTERRINLNNGQTIRGPGDSAAGQPADGEPGSPVQSIGSGKSRGKGRGRIDSQFKVQELSPEEQAARETAVSELLRRCEANGVVGLWEWCRLPEIPDRHNVPGEMWGLYAAEQNDDIEAAFSSLRASVEVEIGIRKYEIIFDGDGSAFAKQVDHQLKKRRYVRRRAVTLQEKQTALEQAAAEDVGSLDPELAEMECAICCTPFKETPTVPIVKLPPCGHCFHGACVQHLADKRSPCPFCRGEVYWSQALAPKPSSGAAAAGAAKASCSGKYTMSHSL
eukprot:TRINITY_DN101129_c0_g1_i1.p1 TRINITY_DN101129_c0_g1~~TRINITY_DN101129_c0_g1_i1.p1  ORF type:complete len:439 (-),score=66.97 TRINITY_DN101129_c0_g1_i1:287-1603(-)